MIGAVPLRGQVRQVSDQRAAFDVASIKPHPSSDTNSNFQFTPGGGLRAVNVSLIVILATAYSPYSVTNHRGRCSIVPARCDMGRFGRLILVLVPAVLTATPSAQVPQDPAFDVAAIKPAADTTAFSYSHVERGGRYIGQNMSLRLLIKTGYGVHDNQIIGVPPWIDSDRWDIHAKAEGYKDAMAFRDMSRLMVRPLLADRFKLVMHHELRRASRLCAGRSEAER